MRRDSTDCCAKLAELYKTYIVLINFTEAFLTKSSKIENEVIENEMILNTYKIMSLLCRNLSTIS